MAGAGGFYIQNNENIESTSEEDDSILSMVMTPSTLATSVNGDPWSPFEQKTLTTFESMANHNNMNNTKHATETSFLVEGTIEEKMCLVQQTDV